MRAARPLRPGDVRRVLLIKLRALGDAVLTLPSLKALAAGFPGARVAVLAPPLARDVYRDDPACAELFLYDPRAPFSPAAYLALVSRLRAFGPDLAVCLHASFRTALLGRLSGAPRRSVRNHSGPDWFATLPASEPKEAKSIIQRDFDALRALGLEPRDARPRLAIPAAARARARALARSWGLGPGGVVLFPGAGQPEKRWPLDRFLGLARSLVRSGRRVLLLTGPGEAGLEPEARVCGAAWGSVGDLKVLAALCALAGHAVGNDSGPRHLAAAAGARTLTLFGPEGLREWHPYAEADGHWALRPDSGNVRDLELDAVRAEVRDWLRASGRPRRRP